MSIGKEGLVTNRSRTFFISAGAAVLFLTLASGSAAQERSDSGSFSFSISSSEDMPLTDGSSLMRTVQSGILMADDPASSLGPAAGTCSGSTVESESLSVGGHCDFVDMDGDVWTIWYKADQEGGSWGFLAGTGKFNGIHGGGTFRGGEAWSDGRGINYWDGTYTLP